MRLRHLHRIKTCMFCCVTAIAGTLHAETLGIPEGDVPPSVNDIVLPETRHEYLVIAQSLDRFFETLARDADVRINVSDAVNQTMVQTYLEGGLDDILIQMAEDHKLDWFMFNRAYYVSTRDEAMTRIVRLGSLDASFTLQALENAGLRMPDYPVETMAEGEALALTGPPLYLALAEAIIETLPERTSEGHTTIIERRGTELTEVVLR